MIETSENISYITKIKKKFLKNEKLNKEKIFVTVFIIVVLLITIIGQNKLQYAYKLLLALFFIIPFFIETSGKLVNIKKSKLSIIWGIMIIYFGFSVFYSIDRHETLYYLFIYVCAFSFLLHQFSQQFFTKLIKIIEYVSIFCAITIIFQAIFPNAFEFLTNWFKIEISEVYDQNDDGYLSGILFEAAKAAFTMCIGIAIVLPNILVKKQKTKTNLVKLILLFVALFLTSKRMLTVIAIFITVLLFLLTHKKSKENYKRLVLAIIGFIIAIAIASLLIPGIGNVFKRFTNLETYSSIGGRENFWKTAIQMFKESPLFGKGLGSFNEYLYEQNFTYYGKWTSNAHNSYLQILGETGIIGLILMLTAFIYTLRNTILRLLKYRKVEKYNVERKRQLYISLAVQIIFLIYALTGNPFHNFTQVVIYAIFIGILNCKSIKTKKRCNSQL